MQMSFQTNYPIYTCNRAGIYIFKMGQELNECLEDIKQIQGYITMDENYWFLDLIITINLWEEYTKCFCWFLQNSI